MTNLTLVKRLKTTNKFHSKFVKKRPCSTRFEMATKLKAIIPPGTVAQRPSRDDGQKLIRKSVRTSRRPKFSIRSKKSTPKKSKKSSKADLISSSHPLAWDAFEQADSVSGETGKKANKSKKKRISFKVPFKYQIQFLSLKVTKVALRTLESDPVADAFVDRPVALQNIWRP